MMRDPGMLPQPFGKGLNASIFQQIDWLVAFEIDEDGPVGMPSTKRKIIHTQNTGCG